MVGVTNKNRNLSALTEDFARNGKVTNRIGDVKGNNLKANFKQFVNIVIEIFIK